MTKHNALFLCTGNAGRSIIAEAILNRIAADRFRAFSAGSRPRGEVHPAAMRLLQSRGFETADLRSKSWDDFARPDAPRLDVVITVCDNVAGEACPVWPGQPMLQHWSIPDPTLGASTAAAVDAAFAETYRLLHERISALCGGAAYEEPDGQVLGDRR
jgi:arsenate reductase (thioredoxin)